MMNVEEVLEQADALVQEYWNLRATAAHDDLSDLPNESAAFVVRLRAAVDRLAPSSSAYARTALASDGEARHVRIRTLVGIVEAIRADMAAGWLRTVEELLRADTFSDFLDMATELLDKDYKDAAAVIAGAVLEGHLRNLCIKVGVPITAEGGPIKSESLNVELRGAGVYNVNKQKQVTAWLGLRNAAAHGHYAEYGPKDVTLLIAGIRQFVDDYSA